MNQPLSVVLLARNKAPKTGQHARWTVDCVDVEPPKFRVSYPLMARNRTSAQKTTAKNRALRRQTTQDRIAAQDAAIVVPAGIVPSAWALIEAEFMKRPPFLLAYQAASCRENSRPLYEAREWNTRLY